MSHRGPDGADSKFLDSGRVALGHRRLSIIDLSETGSQPMSSGNLWVVFNGEIYNFPEIRKELERRGCVFTSNSDTEVLLHGYRVWGQGLCDRLEGMFAFAIYDENSRKLFLARDHVGQKPLFYARVNGCLIVASEIKAIKSFIDRKFEMRHESVIDFLVYGYIPDPNTWFREIKSVLPGHFMNVDAGDDKLPIRETQYWCYTPPVSPASVSTGEAREILSEQVQRCVRSHLIADVDVGALLSGGVDSGSIVATASQSLGAGLQTFSIGFESAYQDELPLARLMAEKFGTTHRERIVEEIEYQSSVDDVLAIFDQPFADSSLVPTRAVCELAAENVKVVLTGDGGDETFGGYNLGTYLSPFHDRQLLRRLKFDRPSAHALFAFARDALRFLFLTRQRWAETTKYPRYRTSIDRELQMMPTEFRRLLKDYDWRWMYPIYTVPGLDPFRQAQWHHLKNILPGKMLVKVDRCAMHYSLESRAPFLSHKLIESMLDLPVSVKNPKADWYKGLLRIWAADMLPSEVLRAPKRGFAVPKDWTVRSALPDQTGEFPNLLDAGILSSTSWPVLRRKEGLLWRVQQIDQAVGVGMF